MIDRIRGTALPETAIVLSLVLLLLLAAVQLSVIGFTQSTADGASFVAAHAQSIGSTTSGASVAQSAFPITAGNVTLSATSSTVQAVTSLTTGGLLLVPGGASTYAISGGDVEPLFSGASTGSNTFGFAVNATLPNYCRPSTPCNALPSSYAIYLAQNACVVGNGNGSNTCNNSNGVNGAFAQWGCHLNGYQTMLQNFPAPGSVGPQGWLNPVTGKIGISTSIYDPTLTSPSQNGNTSGTEGYIYAADSGKSNAGMNC
ncbi:hypothetical protein EPN42_12115 [bacterium]|nr:MAG: hypothetical protein EPN42_12115 [bacterium]